MINLFTYLQNTARELFDKAYNFACGGLFTWLYPSLFFFPQYSIVFLILLSFFKNSIMNTFLFLQIYILLIQPPPWEVQKRYLFCNFQRIGVSPYLKKPWFSLRIIMAGFSNTDDPTHYWERISQCGGWHPYYDEATLVILMCTSG